MNSFQIRTHLVTALLILTLSLTAAAQEAALGLPPELAALDAQFQALQKERVLLPFDFDLGRLKTSYLGGLDKAMLVEKARGDLDATLALENEKQAFTELPEVPEKDEASTPEILKKLRATYRSEFARISAVRVASLSTLTEPLGKRLVQMEKDLTKNDRLEDAKKVRAYREALVLSPTVSPAALAAASSGFTNSLGMKFLPVKGTNVLFCIHETRRQDYAAFAAENNNVAGFWKDQSFKGYTITERVGEHPVDYVSWEDAHKFCDWLSQKEGKMYRLPTDEEWSIAVGLGRKEKRGKDATPEMLNQKEQTQFPWGGDYPPKTKDKAGNYGDTAWTEKFSDTPGMKDYTDGFPTTAPVMSFKPNKVGLYDMGGNVQEWVEDWWNTEKRDHVLRGGSCGLSELGHLLSSFRCLSSPDYRYSKNRDGFRIVMVVQ